MTHAGDAWSVARAAARNTKRKERREAREASDARIALAKAETQRVVESGKCPRCGRGVHRNNSLPGWWQCDGFGADSHRRDKSGEPCSWQGFTE
jgi:hypothetical protein